MKESKNTYYWTCPLCGANLDPNEACDCRKEKPNDDYKLVQEGGDENVKRN